MQNETNHNHRRSDRLLLLLLVTWRCRQKAGSRRIRRCAAKVYVAPGSYDEFYAFMSGGFSGQVSVYGLPSGRLFRVIPVFSQDPEKGYGYSEETKPLLMTSHGFIPWDDAHHPQLSVTDGQTDGRWLFINGNNTPRIARIDLTTFETVETIEIPNSGGNHGSPYLTPNTEYVVASTRFSVPIPQKDVPISSYKENFKGTISYIKVDSATGRMKLAFQILVPGINYDLSRSGKGPSHGWSFFSSYNSEQANTQLEVNASQNDKDFIAAVNWKLAEELVAQGKGQTWPANYYHNYMDAADVGQSEVMNRSPCSTPKSIRAWSTICRRRNRRTAAMLIRPASTLSPAASLPR